MYRCRFLKFWLFLLTVHLTMRCTNRRGKNHGSTVFPGNVTVVQAQIPDDKLDQLLDDLESFKQEKEAHQHLQGLVLPVDKRL